MKKAEEIIWEYLDGRASAEERSQVETRLEEDPAFREMFLESRQLHGALQEMEVAVPSLRFTQNIMDKLPAVRNLATEPLVSKRWLGAFNLSVVALILLILGSSVALSGPAAAQFQPSRKISELFLRIFADLPPNTLILGGIISICLLSLLALDHWLQTRWEGSR